MDISSGSQTSCCKILIADRDTQFWKSKTFRLSELEFHCVGSYQDAITAIHTSKYDLAIIERAIGGGDGLMLMQTIKSLNPQALCTLLSDKQDLHDKVYCLGKGADEYLSKCSLDAEFIARMHMQLRLALKLRKAEVSNAILKFGDLTLQLDMGKAYVKGQDLLLTQTEFKLLRHLAKNPGVTVSRSELLSEVWGYKSSRYIHTLNSHMNRLRSKLKSSHESMGHIETSRSRGYTFVY